MCGKVVFTRMQDIKTLGILFIWPIIALEAIAMNAGVD
jgi:hypothetical protein